MIPFLPTPDGILVTLEPDDLDLLRQLPEFLAQLGDPGEDPAASRLQVPVYLDDPEGNGIEIYVDRPAASWGWQDGLVAMATERMDLDGESARRAR